MLRAPFPPLHYAERILRFLRPHYHSLHAQRLCILQRVASPLRCGTQNAPILVTPPGSRVRGRARVEGFDNP